MNPEIYREYDIRGVVGADFTDDEVIVLGKGFGTYFHRLGIKTIALGRDCRLSSPTIRKGLSVEFTHNKRWVARRPLINRL